MFSGHFSYPYAEFRRDLGAIKEILSQTQILRMNGDWWDVGEDENDYVTIGIKVGSYFFKRIKDKDQALECHSVFMMAMSMIDQHLETFAPNRDLEEVIESGFDLASESLLQAVHALNTEVDIREWGDDRQDTFAFLLEIARTRFGYAD